MVWLDSSGTGTATCCSNSPSNGIYYVSVGNDSTCASSNTVTLTVDSGTTCSASTTVSAPIFYGDYSEDADTSLFVGAGRSYVYDHLSGCWVPVETSTQTITTVDSSSLMPKIVVNPHMPEDEVWIIGPSGSWIHKIKELTPEEKLKRKIQEQLEPELVREDGSPFRATGGSADFSKVQQNEIVALQLLRKMLDKDRWRKYLKYGFVDVQGKSGMTYQILRGQAHVKVFKKGTKVCELCVKLRNQAMPPTDEVITRMIIADCDEPDLWKRANVYMQQGYSAPRAYTEPALELVARQAAA